MFALIKESRWLLAIVILLFVGQVFGHGMSEAEKQTIIEGGNLGYIWIGATHMLSGLPPSIMVCFSASDIPWPKT